MTNPDAVPAQVAPTFGRLAEILVRDYGQEEAQGYLELIHGAVTALQHIRDYVEEAMKLRKCAFCRQIITSGPGGDLYTQITGAFCPANHSGVGHADDEAEGLYRLVLSETK